MRFARDPNGSNARARTRRAIHATTRPRPQEWAKGLCFFEALRARPESAQRSRARVQRAIHGTTRISQGPSDRVIQMLLVLVLVVLGLGLVAGGRAQAPSDVVHYRQIRVRAFDGTDQRVLVTFPRRADGREHAPHERLPLVIALHGQGEARRGAERGFLGWVTDYHLPDAFAALQRGVLTEADYQSFVRSEHLAARNAALHAHPFRGLVVVTPYTPDLMAEPPGGEQLRAYGDWLVGPMLAAVRAELPFVAQTRAGTGIDGVSLGGMIALEVGLRHSAELATVGGIQPAVRDRVAALAASAEGNQRIRLLSSDDDPFLGVTRELSGALQARHIDHDLVVTPGPHGYDFNRGPGGLELLYFHDRALAREPM
jgi:enterochelin esterase-like enzyme